MIQDSPEPGATNAISLRKGTGSGPLPPDGGATAERTSPGVGLTKPAAGGSPSAAGGDSGAMRVRGPLEYLDDLQAAGTIDARSASRTREWLYSLVD